MCIYMYVCIREYVRMHGIYIYIYIYNHFVLKEKKVHKLIESIGI